MTNVKHVTKKLAQITLKCMLGVFTELIMGANEDDRMFRLDIVLSIPTSIASINGQCIDM
jgi:hypothetical protein